MHYGTRRNQANADPEASSLLTSIHTAGKYCTHNQSRKVTICFTQLCILGATIATGLTRHAHWYNRRMNIVGFRNPFLIEGKTYSPGWNHNLSLGTGICEETPRP